MREENEHRARVDVRSSTPSQVGALIEREIRRSRSGTTPARPTGMSLDGFRVLDVPVTGRIRVRSWHHTAGRRAFPVGAHSDIEVAWVTEGVATYRIGRRNLEV